MTTSDKNSPSFNLWSEPWIALEHDGIVTQHSIRDTLLNARDYVAIYDSSPLVVVAIHRLLTAILQDALNPQENRDLEQLWKDGKFPADKIERFGKQYADRFDLFSEDKPFLQSADLPLFPNTKDEQKEKTTVARLFPEIPSGTEVTHYRHGSEDEQVLSPASVARGLVIMPPFMSSGGGGGKFMPSINGAPPPIYVLPGGRTLFEILAASLISVAKLKDDYASINGDLAWWTRPVPVIVQESKKKKPGMSPKEHRQLSEVGYLHGLTFPARKVRLHPEQLNAICSRSGQVSEWCVKTIVFKMGESRLEDAALWKDPFVAYKLPTLPEDLNRRRKLATTKRKKTDNQPKTIKAQRGRVGWREFTGLFLENEKKERTQRPRFLAQFADLTVSDNLETYPFRCIGLQAKADAKIFEWFDFGFDVPPSLLQDPDGAKWTEEALDFTTKCTATITRVFSTTFGRKAKKAERFKRLKERLEADYWAVLAGEFRQFVLALGDGAKQQQTLEEWLNTAVHRAQDAFDGAADSTGDDGNTLRQIVQGKSKCREQLNILRSKTKQGGWYAGT